MSAACVVSCALAAATISAIDTSGPPMLYTSAPVAGRLAASMKARAASAPYCSCVLPPKGMLKGSPRAAAAIA